MNNGLTKGLFVLSVFALFGMLVMGCLGGGSTTASPTPTVSATEEPTIPPFPSDEPTITATPVPTITDTRTGDDKINESIKAAIADGSYSQKVGYTAPSGAEEIEVSVTVKDDVVTEATVLTKSSNQFTQKWVSAFAGELPTLVVGKKVSDIAIPKNVAGSSLTSAAFKGYLEKLIEEN